jgi:GGDEF domain-containing protein
MNLIKKTEFSNNKNYLIDDSIKDICHDEIEKFSQEIFMYMSKNNIIPTPANYSLYFDRIILDKNKELQKCAEKYLNKTNFIEQVSLENEKKIKTSYLSVKKLLKEVFFINKSIHVLNNLLSLSKEKNNEQIKNELKNITGFMDNIKTEYNNLNIQIQEINKTAIFNNEYGIYNRNFLDKKISEEIISLKNTNIKSSLLSITLSKKVMDNKDFYSVVKSVLSQIFKTTRRNDVLGYYDVGIFMISLSQTDSTHAVMAAKRIIEIIQNTTLFVGYKEVKLDIDIGIIEYDSVARLDNIYKKVIEAMHHAHNNSSINYYISS